ncbi:hypothetical protein BBJ28_00026826, partial [Nothophytophthora sp. Chile5]
RGRQLASLVRAGGRARNQQQTNFEVAISETARGPLVLLMCHRWLDAVGNVQGHPDLNKWTAHSDLGRIVSEVVTELRVAASSAQVNKLPPASPATSNSPATSMSSLSPAYRGSQLSYPSPSRMSPQAQQQPQKPQEPSKMQHTQMPVIPAVFPELEELSYVHGRLLSSDRHALKKFVKDLTSVKEFIQLRDEVLRSNMGIANATLGHESELRELQDALLEQLSAAAKDVDNATDDVASQFAHGEIDVAQFIATYLPQRSLYHERTLKLARVHQH